MSSDIENFSKVPKVLVLCHESLVPHSYAKVPNYLRSATPNITEIDVCRAIRSLGWKFEVLGLFENLEQIAHRVKVFKPDVIFNLAEEFAGKRSHEVHLRSYLELLNIPVTGADALNLAICKDKVMTNHILQSHGLTVPNHTEILTSSKKNVSKLLKNENMEFPVIVKGRTLESSEGISKSSVVKTVAKLIERIRWFQEKFDATPFCESFIPGEDLTQSIFIEREKTTTFLPTKLIYKQLSASSEEVYGHREKWSETVRSKKGIQVEILAKNDVLSSQLTKMTQKIAEALRLSGYARVDYRKSEDGKIYVIEVNPNPNLAIDDELALSAKKSGWSYETLIANIIKSRMKSPGHKNMHLAS